jgi:hypothetical protein
MFQNGKPDSREGKYAIDSLCSVWVAAVMFWVYGADWFMCLRWMNISNDETAFYMSTGHDNV